MAYRVLDFALTDVQFRIQGLRVQVRKSPTSWLYSLQRRVTKKVQRSSFVSEGSTCNYCPWTTLITSGMHDFTHPIG